MEKNSASIEPTSPHAKSTTHISTCFDISIIDKIPACDATKLSLICFRDWSTLRITHFT